MNIVWDEISCCGEHRTGQCVFKDGETVYVKLCGDGTYYAKALLNGMMNKESNRVASGEGFNLTESDIKGIK